MTAYQHRRNIIKMIEEIGRRHHRWQVFSDFVESAAICISNTVDLANFVEREKRFEDIKSKYEKAEHDRFPEMFSELVLAMEDETHDALGMLFHELELHNKYVGQFFTPYSLCKMIATLTTEELPPSGYVSVLEPACGAGAMLIAKAMALLEAGINPQKHMHATAVDIDQKCVHMTYVQLSLLGIPAIVIHGNTITLEEWHHWRTPMHILGLWDTRHPECEIIKPGTPIIEQLNLL